MKTAILSSTYFGPVQWYQKLYRYDRVLIENHDSFIKQTYRNRCVIATANGPLALTVPVDRNEELRMKNEESIRQISSSSQKDLLRINTSSQFSPHRMDSSFFILNSSLKKISDHGNWRHQHWNALVSAYGDSPFFEYYADDIRPFFEKRWDNLYEFNLDITRKMCELLDIQPNIELTDSYADAEAIGADDFRDAIRPKHPLPDSDFTPQRYYQVYEQRHGFISNMSILDLLFNMGNESILYL